MKLVVVIVALLASTSTTQSYKDEWTSFKKQHGKSYKSQAEENFRLSIFMDNMKFIEGHNARFKAGLESYYLTMNHLGDLLSGEVSSSMFGLNKNYSDVFGIELESEQPVEFIPLDNAKTPATVDWMKEGAVTPVKYQGTCGSCWAFSTTGTMEGQLFRKTGKLIPLSEQQLVDCDKHYNNGCQGGLMVNAYRYLKGRGLQSENTYPYEARESQCKFNPSKIVSGTKVRSWSVIRKGDLNRLRQAVAAVGPIAVGINADNKSFRFYGGGIFTEDKCYTSPLDHAVLLVGYSSEHGNDYWLVKNSWGTRWGEKGYIRFARNRSNICGLASMASYPLL